jgi:hypothetical protein
MMLRESFVCNVLILDCDGAESTVGEMFTLFQTPSIHHPFPPTTYFLYPFCLSQEGMFKNAPKMRTKIQI